MDVVGRLLALGRRHGDGLGGDEELVTGEEDIGTSPLGLVGNIVWFVFAGIWLAIGHVFTGLLLCVTIIGIPFGVQHFKIAAMALAPIGKTVIETEDYMH